MITLKGDLLKFFKNGECDVIVHGCNCFCTMGAGIAKQIKEEFPEALAVDRTTEQGDISKLGGYTSVKTDYGTIVNAYTQYGYNARSRQVDYDAIYSVFESINKDFAGSRIMIPFIGCGLAGGNWNIVEKIIDEVCTNVDIFVVEYVEQPEKLVYNDKEYTREEVSDYIIKNGGALAIGDDDPYKDMWKQFNTPFINTPLAFVEYWGVEITKSLIKDMPYNMYEIRDSCDDVGSRTRDHKTQSFNKAQIERVIDQLGVKHGN